MGEASLYEHLGHSYSFLTHFPDCFGERLDMEIVCALLSMLDSPQQTTTKAQTHIGLEEVAAMLHDKVNLGRIRGSKRRTVQFKFSILYPVLTRTIMSS